MRWDMDLPWVPREAGERPTTLRQWLGLARFAVWDLPQTLRHDAVTEMAAGMTFFLLFSLFPMLVFLVTFLPFLPPEVSNIDVLFDALRPILPAEVYDLLHNHLTSLLTQPRRGIAVVSASIALFSASRALVSLSRALNRTYRVPGLKSEWLRRLRSMALTVLVLVGFLVAVFGLTVGNNIVAWLIASEWLPVGQGTLIVVVRWPLLFLLAAFLVQQLYYLLPDRSPRWRALSAGSMLAVLGWVVSTWLFTSVAARFLQYNVAYGSLGSIAVVMAWLYLGSLALMVGASFNALIERGLPPGARSYGDEGAAAPPTDEE